MDFLVPLGLPDVFQMLPEAIHRFSILVKAVKLERRELGAVVDAERVVDE